MPPMRPTVLIADDDTALRAAAAAFFSVRGYTVVQAGNGHEALMYLQRGAVVNVIVLDLAMPVMDGWAFLDARQATDEIARIPTIVLSDTPATDLRCRDLPVTAYCAKPFQFEFLAALTDALAEAKCRSD